MGAEISSLLIEPTMGAIIIALAIFAIIKQNSGDVTSAKWLAIAAICVTILLIVINIVLTFMV